MLIALRFIANVFFLIAAIALVADITPALQGVGSFKLTSFVTHWAELSPKSFTATKKSMIELDGGFIWNIGIKNIIAIPSAILFAILGGLFGYLGRRRKRTNIFIN
ncbi:MAG: hypothetical protein ACRBCJ_03905 [Hyphomicrobiaceae bacterium]